MRGSPGEGDALVDAIGCTFEGVEATMGTMADRVATSGCISRSALSGLLAMKAISTLPESTFPRASAGNLKGVTSWDRRRLVYIGTARQPVLPNTPWSVIAISRAAGALEGKASDYRARSTRHYRSSTRASLWERAPSTSTGMPPSVGARSG